MIEEFSDGYYVGRFTVAAREGEHAHMDRDDLVAANERVYDDGAIRRLDRPLLVKVDGTYLPVFAGEDVPENTIALPDATLQSTTVTDPPTLKDVYVAKPDRAAQLLEWYTPYTVRDPDLT